jgi:hypothetical protein
MGARAWVSASVASTNLFQTDVPGPSCELFQLEIFPRYIWGAFHPTAIYYCTLLYSSTVRLYLVGKPVSVRQMLL